MGDDFDRWRASRRSFLGWTAALGAALLTRPALAVPVRDEARCGWRTRDTFVSDADFDDYDIRRYDAQILALRRDLMELGMTFQ